MGIKLRSKLMLLFATFAMLLAMPTVALADTLNVNDLQTNGNTSKEAGQGGTAKFWLENQNNRDGDPVNSCNASATQNVRVAVSATAKDKDGNSIANAPISFANPGYVDIADCGEVNAKNLGYSVGSSAQAGTVITVSGTATGGKSGGTFTNDNFTITVAAPPAPSDTTAPVLSLPNNITEEATGPNGAVVSYSASANDAVDGNRPVNCSPESGSTFPLGTTPVNCSSSDTKGNTSTGSFTVTVRDTTAPQLTVPSSPIVVEATSSNGAVANFASQVSAQDAVDSNPQINCNPASGNTFTLGSTQVSCTATDTAGNTSAAKTFDVTVQDTTAPSLSNMPANISQAATSSSGAVVNYTNPTASDAVDPNPQVSCNPASGSNFSLGQTTVSCTATDSANNTSAVSTFKVNVTYGVAGILQPINGGLTLGNHSDDSSAFKLGSTVPVKFQLSGASAGIDNATANLRITKVTNNQLDGAELEATTTTAASSGSLFRYDTTSGQYIYNWGTKSYTAGTYQLRIDLGDGNGSHTVWVSLRK